MDITLRLATADELERRAGGVPPGGYFADARLDKDLFDSKSGDIEIIFDASLVPASAVAKDILFFGDVRGELVDSSR